jgi:hypothetical protein
MTDDWCLAGVRTTHMSSCSSYPLNFATHMNQAHLDPAHTQYKGGDHMCDTHALGHTMLRVHTASLAVGLLLRAPFAT